MQWPIRLQIMIPFCILTFLLLAIVSAVNAYIASRAARQHIVNQLDGIAATLEKSTFPWTASVLRQASGLSGAAFAVTDPTGVVRVATIDVGRQLDVAPRPAALAPLGRSVDVRGTPFFDRQITRLRPGDHGSSAVLHVLYPKQMWHEARREAILPPFYIGIAAMVVVIGLARVIANHMSHPIEQLQQQVGRIAAGDFRPLTLPARRDELGKLTVSINLLARQLDHTRQAIQRAERFSLLGQLSGGLAHQLRNAITGARMAVQLHQENCRDADPESLDVALFQLASTEKQLRQLLRVGKPQPLTRTPRGLQATLHELVTQIKPLCDHHHVAFDTTVAGEELELFADHEQLQQALGNLIRNAVEATACGGHVRLAAELAEPGWIRLCVIDDGPGVAPEIAARLFEPFASSKSEGVGLGLVLAKQVIEQHGGRVRYVRTDVTTFEVIMPTEGRE